MGRPPDEAEVREWADRVRRSDEPLTNEDWRFIVALKDSWLAQAERIEQDREWRREFLERAEAAEAKVLAQARVIEAAHRAEFTFRERYGPEFYDAIEALRSELHSLECKV